MANRKITWSKSSLKQFEAAINYIAECSIQNAEKVRKEILEKIERLILYSEIYSPDKYKTNNDGSYRAFELHRYRIAYRIKENEILIFRVRHTSRELCLPNSTQKFFATKNHRVCKKLFKNRIFIHHQQLVRRPTAAFGAFGGRLTAKNEIIQNS
jgi:plasmid stabilization system protein ParE